MNNLEFFDANFKLSAFSDTFRGQNMGELISASLYIGIFLIMIVFFHVKADRDVRLRAWVNYLLLTALGFFCIISDLIHSYVWMRQRILGGVTIEER